MTNQDPTPPEPQETVKRPTDWEAMIRAVVENLTDPRADDRTVAALVWNLDDILRSDPGPIFGEEDDISW